MFLVLRHHKMLSGERANDIASTFQVKKIMHECGWASAVEDRAFSAVIKSQVVSKQITY